MVKPRTFPVPAFVASAHLGQVTTLDGMELVSGFNGEAGDWARRVLSRSRPKYLNRVTDSERRLPSGLLAAGTDMEVVVGLLDADGTPWVDPGWQLPPVEPATSGGTVDLHASDVAFVVRAFDEGACGVILNPATPTAWLDRPVDHNLLRRPLIAAATEAKAKGYAKLPDDAKIIAVVDELDRNAVLELLAVLSGARVLRRHDGLWYPDADWARTLRSVKPPPVVALKDDLRQSVITQVDEATKDQPWEPTVKEPKPRGKSTGRYGVAAAVELLEESADQAFCQAMCEMAVIADIGSPVSGMPANLQKYWAFGKGALKIRWNTPGSWTRCHRQLSKYIGPYRAKGACTNLAKLRGGHGVATHVGEG